MLFEQALALGMDRPAIHYNIGVAAYRSGDLARAERAFEEVARTPAMAALAHYNLGLVALQRGEQRAARREFERAASEPGDERLAALAAQRLEELPAAHSLAAWSLYARGGAGYDDNVALRSDSIDGAGSGEDDAFVDLTVSASGAFGQHWHVDAAVAALEYLELDEFDQGVLSLGVRRGFALDAWYLEAGGYGTQLTLGHDVFERSAAAGLRATRSFSGGRRLQAWLRATAVDGEGDFSGLSGARAELGANYDWSWQAWSFDSYGRAELNDSDDEAFATRWAELGARAQWAMSPRWTFSAGASARLTRHPADDTQAAREDRRATFGVGAAWRRWQQAQLLLRYQHERNSSPLEQYEYDRAWVSASIEFWH